MKYLDQKIAGVKLIKHEPFVDERGSFTRTYCKNIFNSFGIEKNISQANLSFNKYNLTLRGFHYQEEPYSQARTINCIVGSIYDIVVDLRKKSKTYLKWISFEINDTDNISIYVPKGCANAFLTLKSNTICNYFFSSDFYPSAYKGIRYNDPLFGFKWKKKPKYISKKDLSYSDFKANV